MLGAPLATLAAPSGILTALDRRCAERGWTRSTLLARAGLVQADWDALSTALGGANAANLRRLLNASNVFLSVADSPVAQPPGTDGLASPNSYNAPINTAYGDLT
ncbi:hypothetical protein [Methylosinus sp. PW1]|uniref:hypothetical protein n=1 Tax=Methylosinus sp. PW1 TaxID=107636 RepID=UPI000B0258AB|nr:hypothetical protein [Methylosinus sp. PW1]